MTDNEQLLATLARVENRLDSLEKAHATQAKTAEELLDMYESVRGFFRILAWMERVSIWIAKMAMAGSIVWWLLSESIKRTIENISGGK